MRKGFAKSLQGGKHVGVAAENAGVETKGRRDLLSGLDRC